jgi:hypothetical protein
MDDGRGQEEYVHQVLEAYRKTPGTIGEPRGDSRRRDAHSVSMKLEDTLRGVERLRTATGTVGQATFSQACREMNLAGDCLDDIPDRRTPRQLIEALEREAGATPLRQNGSGHGGASANRTSARCGNELGVARADLVREAQRVGKLRNMKVSDVIDRAAKRAFRFGELQRLTDALVGPREA